MFKFEHQYLLNFLWLLPAFFLLFVMSRRAVKKKLLKFGDSNVIAPLFKEQSKYKAWVKFFLLSLSFASLIIGLANPQIGSKMEEVKRQGIEVIIALDVSNSMLAEDIKPNRLERAKQSMQSLINKLAEDKIGIIVFAGQSFLQLPLTTDYSAAKLMVSTINTDLIGTQGTAIGSAIDMAMESFSKNEGVSRVILVITDGENHEDDALGSARSAYENGILIHTIGMGSIEGAPIPVGKGSNSDFLRDRSGSVVVSKLDGSMLQQLAATGGGQFIRSGSSDPDLASLVTELGKLEKSEIDSKVFTEFDDKFQYFIALALLFLLIEMLIADKKNRLLQSLSKFAEGKK